MCCLSQSLIVFAFHTNVVPCSFTGCGNFPCNHQRLIVRRLRPMIFSRSVINSTCCDTVCMFSVSCMIYCPVFYRLDGLRKSVDGGLQALVAAQMMAIHKLQQTSMALAKGLPYGECSKYYTNTSIKLSNTFIQQATLLAKLQGSIGQKITVERVDVSHGGQAVIGTVNSGSST